MNPRKMAHDELRDLIDHLRSRDSVNAAESALLTACLAELKRRWGVSQ